MPGKNSQFWIVLSYSEISDLCSFFKNTNCFYAQAIKNRLSYTCSNNFISHLETESGPYCRKPTRRYVITINPLQWIIYLKIKEASLQEFSSKREITCFIKVTSFYNVLYKRRLLGVHAAFGSLYSVPRSFCSPHSLFSNSSIHHELAS